MIGRFVVALIAGMGILAVSPLCSAAAVRVEDGYFLDAEGREVLLRGLNAGAKHRRTGYMGWHGPEDFEQMRAWGFNCVRLLVIWAGLEPEPGDYDEAYLERLDQRVDWAHAAGLHVILDMHQDLYGESIPGADGAPAWATLDDGRAHHRPAGSWGLAYFTSPKVHHAFDSFWKNRPGPGGIGIQDRYARAWRHVAQRYGEHSAVIGYDVMNEPFMGSAVRGAVMAALPHVTRLVGQAKDAKASKAHIQLIRALEDQESYAELLTLVEASQKGFEEERLPPFYQRVTEAIREVDEDGIVFFEPNLLANVGVRSFVRPIRRADGTVETQQAYMPHIYDLVTDTPDVAQPCAHRIETIFARLREGAQAMGLPMLIGEWGAFYGSDKALDAARLYVRQFEEGLAGDFYWDYHRGLGKTAFLSALSRPYPEAVAGRLLACKTDWAAGVFTCRWREEAAATAPTRVYLPLAWLRDEATWEVRPQGPEPQLETAAQRQDGAFLLVPPRSMPGERTFTVTQGP